MSEETYNKEDLRHKQTSEDAKKAYAGDRRAFLKGHLESIREETRLQNEEIQEVRIQASLCELQLTLSNSTFYYLKRSRFRSNLISPPTRNCHKTRFFIR